MDGLPSGIHVLTLEAIDELGGIGWGDVEVQVGKNEPPTIEIISPVVGTTHNQGDNIHVEVNFDDDMDSLEELELTWSGIVDWAWVDGSGLPTNPTSSGVVNGSILLDCPEIDNSKLTTYELVVTATDTNGYSSQAAAGFGSNCLAVE